MSKKFTVDEKMMIIQESYEVGNRSLVAKKYGTNESTIRTWIKTYNNKNFGIKNDLTYNKILKENDKLKKLLGEKDLEIAILREINGKKF